MFNLLDAIIVRPIVNIMFIVYDLVGDFGLAVIIFTIIVKIAIWPLMKRQLHQTRIMRQIQPELAEIKKNCKGNRQLESIQMMDLYKRKNIKPFRSIVTMLIQLPIFISLFTAINVMVRPRFDESRPYNVQHSAYEFTANLPRIKEIITIQEEYREALVEDANAEYPFYPKLFNTVNLSSRAGVSNLDSVIILVFALTSTGAQFIMLRQNDPSRNGKKRKTFRQIMKETASGKEPDQSEVNAIAQSQMSFTTPIMMFFIMINLPGAVVFYYMLSNIITIVLQKIMLNRNYTEMENTAEKRVLKELRDAKEAIIVKDETIAKNEAKIARIKAKEKKSHFSRSKNKNKTNITRISASTKKKRR